MLPYLEDAHELANWLGQRNLARQYDFMNTSFALWQTHGTPKPTLRFLSDLNFYATHHLSPFPGKFRHAVGIDVRIDGAAHKPPLYGEVEALLNHFIVTLHRMYDDELPVRTAAYALWRLNWIHPFVQGNGRTSRAICYFIILQKYNIWLPGTPLHELIRQNREEYCQLLVQADERIAEDSMTDLAPMEEFLQRLLAEQIGSVRRA